MRTPVRTLAAVSVAAAAAVVAIPANGASKKPSPCKPVPKSGVAYQVRGTLVVDATSRQLVLKVTGGNSAGKAAVKNAGGVYDAGAPIGIASCSKVARVVGKSTATHTWRKLKAGDRVLVSWKAKKGKTLANLGAAQRVVELKR